MEKKRISLAGRLTRKMLVWMFFIVIGLSYIMLHFEGKSTRQFYSEIYRNKMLTIKEYTRRVISDVYVAVTNNVYYLEHTLDNPDAHKETMARIVQSGTRVRSCGISFIEDYYYPKKGHRYCPFAWRNVTNPDVVYKEDMGDADLDYLTADWFLDVINSDSAQWAEPFYDGYDETTALSAYMMPIHDESGRVVAALGADVSLDWFTTKLNEVDTVFNMNSMLITNLLDLRSKSYLINHDGTFLTNPDKKLIMKDNFYTKLETCKGSDVQGLINKMKACDESSETFSDRYLVNGEECFLLFSPVKYTNWLFVTVVPCRAIDLMSILNGITVLLVVILTLLLVVVMTYYFIKNGVEPLKQLTTLTGDIAKGKFNSSIPELNHNDEISQLRDSIENLKYALSNYIDDVKRTAATETNRQTNLT